MYYTKNPYPICYSELHYKMHDLGKSPRFKILYNLNLKNSVTYLKNNSSPIFSIPENDGLQSTDLAQYNPP